MLRVRLGRECTVVGGCQTFGVSIRGLGVYLFVVALFVFFWGGCSSVLPSFQGLEVGSYSHHRVVGGDQSLKTCNNRKEIVGKVGYIWLIPLVG